MGEPENMTSRTKAELVAEMLPGHTLDFRGQVIPIPICPLCGQPVDTWTPSNTIKYMGKMVTVHQVCPAGGSSGN